MRRPKKDLGTNGVLRVDARANRLTTRLRAGDIAVLDHVDLDSATAQLLVSRGVVAVVNAAPSSSGRYPNLGPSVLVAAGIPLLDDVGPEVLTTLRDGRAARLDGDTLWVEEQRAATGVLQDGERVERTAAHARAGLAAQLADALGGAQTFLVEERDLLLENAGLPDLAVDLAGRHVLLVGPLPGAAPDLRLLRRYCRRFEPFVVGVDAGADTALQAGLSVGLAVGDPTTMTDEVLRCAGQVVLRQGGEGLARVQDLAVPVLTCRTRAASEDLALLLVRRAVPALVVLTGVPLGLEEVLDRGREAAASSFVTRMAASSSVLSARAALALTPRRRWGLPALCVVLGGLAVLFAGVGHAEVVHTWRDLGR